MAAITMLEARVDGSDIWLLGGGVTASYFLNEDLIDLIELTVVPVILGEGKPLFPGAQAATTFEMISSRVGRLGLISTVYARRGQPSDTM